MRKTQARRNRADWISSETKRMMVNRDAARDKAALSTLQEYWECYKALRNRCTSMIKKDRNWKLSENFKTLQENNDAKGPVQSGKKKNGMDP